MEEVESLSDSKNDILKKKIYKLEEKNIQWVTEVDYLKASMEMLHEQATPLQEDNKILFDQYHTLKEDNNTLLL